MTKPSATDRFSSRVDDYQKYRPSYPAEIFPVLEAEFGLRESSVIADIGSGTGISSELFLARGNPVFAVEPNQPMRQAAELRLGRYPTFNSVDGRAEATGLAAASVDFVLAAQAFHWFDFTAARTEFARILRPGGQLLLLWNERLTEASAFLREYERLLRTQAVDYNAVNHADTVPVTKVAELFAPRPFGNHSFPNHQTFDWEGLRGRARSSSYVPAPEHPRHAAFFAGLQSLFERQQAHGVVTFEYLTRLYWGELCV
jgi:SAM-dependent methyltransferase